MATPRADFGAAYSTATGRVLVAGGTNATGTIAPAELFTGAGWSATGAMTEKRSYFNLAHMPTTDRFLAVAGINASNTATCETYNPSTGTWTATAALDVPATGTMMFGSPLTLANGKVLSFGNYRNPSLSKTYDPSSGTWTATGTFPKGYWTMAALLTTNGVLASDGAGAALFDPVTGQWRSTGPQQVSQRQDGSLTAFAGGKALLVGGGNALSTAAILRRDLLQDQLQQQHRLQERLQLQRLDLREQRRRWRLVHLERPVQHRRVRRQHVLHDELVHRAAQVQRQRPRHLLEAARHRVRGGRRVR